MAPGVIQNSETVINNTLEVISRNEDLLPGLSDEVNTCPIDHLVLAQVNKDQNGDNSNNGENGEAKILIQKLDRKQPRKVTRPKVLKNHESREYLYDRLYDSTCPRVVSSLYITIIINKRPVVAQGHKVSL